MVLATRGEEFAIGRHSYFKNFMFVALQPGDLLKRRRIPQTNGMIGTDAEKPPSIRRECDASYPGRVVG